MNPNELVLTIPRSSLPSGVSAQGLPPLDWYAAASLMYDILGGNSPCKFLPRGQIEHDPRYVQICPYTVVLQDSYKEPKVLTHVRTSGDPRLHHRRVLGLSGHAQDRNITNEARRELNEELRIGGGIRMSTIPFTGVYSFSEEPSESPANVNVAQVHIGLVFLALSIKVNPLIAPNENGITDLQWVPVQHIPQLEGMIGWDVQVAEGLYDLVNHYPRLWSRMVECVVNGWSFATIR